MRPHQTSLSLEYGLVLDNGAGSVKAGTFPLHGLESSTPPIPLAATNALARVGSNATTGRVGTSKRPPHMLVGAEIDSAPDFSAMAFRRAHDRGYVARWDAERDVWASVFSEDLGIALPDPGQTSLLLTEPVATPGHMRRAMDEMVFEVFGFGEYAAAPAARLVALGAEAALLSGKTARRKHKSPTCLVLDSGFSFTHAVPVVGGREVPEAVRRLNLGGKALTNFLKETVSFRSWNMMEETAVVNAVKERTCYVSKSFMSELAASKGKASPTKLEYILPDLSCGGTDPLGHIRLQSEELDGTEQILVMNNERISVPELLFNPSDLGVMQAGVAELIVQAVQSCPEAHRADLYANVVLVGGNCCFPGFKERVQSELRPLVPDIYEVAIFMDSNPKLSAYYGGIEAFRHRAGGMVPAVTKAEYEEHGHTMTLKRFGTSLD